MRGPLNTFQPNYDPMQPMWQGDPAGAPGGGFGGGLSGLAANHPAMGQQQQGWRDYLTGQGWDGQGMPWQYAQQLRQQGEHPRWDYNHPGQPWPGGQMQGNGAGGGINPNYPNLPQNGGGIVPPNFPSSFAPQAPGAPMMGLGALLRRNPPIVAR